MATEKCGCGAIVYYVAPGTGPVLCESCAETALRTDERAKVTAEIVTWLKIEAQIEWDACNGYLGNPRAHGVVALRDAASRIERGSYRPKPGQPKEGE